MGCAKKNEQQTQTGAFCFVFEVYMYEIFFLYLYRLLD